MNHKFVILIVALLSVLAAPRLSAQTASQLLSEFQSTLQGSDKNKQYSALYKAYEANMHILKNTQPNTLSYNEAKNGLLQLWPYLENAAIFFSSQNQASNATYMAQAYIEMPLMDDFKGMDFNYSTNRAKLAYYVGSRYFNNHNYEKSIPFLYEYLKTGDNQNRKNVFICLIKACKETNNTQIGTVALREAVNSYPNDWNIVSIGINFCQDINDLEGLKNLLEKGMALRPNDTTLLNIQAKLYEDVADYSNALNSYLKILQLNPNSLEVNKHVALNYFNIGALNSNKAMTETNSKSKEGFEKEAAKYFSQAIPYLEKIVNTETQSTKYNTALAIAYAQTNRTDQLAQQNQKLNSIGSPTISSNYIPQMMSFANNGFNSGNQVASAAVQNASTSSISSVAANNTNGRPRFSEFAKAKIEKDVNQWQQKDPYETADEFRQRVTEEARNQKIAESQHKAEEDYINQYTTNLTIRNFKLLPYDAENEVFLIESDMGQMVLPVPRANNEARIFEQNWNGMGFSQAKYFISNDDLAIAELTFTTPTGKSYKYNNSDALTYVQTKVDVKFDNIDYSSLAQNNTQAKTPRITTQELSVGASDVDMNIPEGKKENPYTFALIFSNENYQMVSKVPAANNDGNVFAQYCEKTLRLPKQNIMRFSDASYGVMLAGMKQLKDIAEAYKNDDFNVIFYYAGHGIPNEASKDGYLLPTDANGQQTEVCYSLKKLYSELGDLGAKSVVVFLDACFSGAEREGGMIASARGVAIKAKEEAPKGNMVVFSAATGDETAYPYKEKNHGLFTYYLLKKLQESEGNATLKQLGDYIQDNVRKKSVLINHKSQNPTVTPSSPVMSTWENMKLNN